MSTALATTKAGGALMTPEHAASIRKALSESVYPGAKPESVDMVINYCAARNLDPLMKPVHIVPMWIEDKHSGAKGMRDVVMPGVALYRIDAHRTGEYAGQDEPRFGEFIDGNVGGVSIRYPDWCSVTVYRFMRGERVGFTGRVYWLETYATKGKDTAAPNVMWAKRPIGQLEKCAEALALRKAFPEAVGGENTADEMEGKSIEGSFVEIPKREAVSMPTSNSEKAGKPAASKRSAKAEAKGKAPPEDDETDVCVDASTQPRAEASGINLTGASAETFRNLIGIKLRRAGYADEAALLADFPAINDENVNDVLAALNKKIREQH